MLKIKTPASTSNLGPGFDCLGLALDLYNSFDVDLSETDELIGVDEAFNNENNLFLKAYHLGMKQIGLDDHVRVSFHTAVPVSRGLGSSSTLIVGGLLAASALHNDALDKDHIFQLAAMMEGHPDNAAPCVYGGFCASFKDEEGNFFTRTLTFSEDFKITLFIPDFEVETANARRILPDVYPRKIAVANASKAILTVKALVDGDLELLKKCAKDELHEPYRRTLISEYDEVKKLFIKDTDGVFLISGSGSTCIGISRDYFEESSALSALKHHWQVKEVSFTNKGAMAYEV